MRMKLILEMKSGFSRLAILLFLCGGVSALTSVVLKGYHHVQYHFTWQQAQDYCRRLYTDLATIYTQSDSDSLDLEDYYAWVGLHRKNNDWEWSNSHSDYTPQWAYNEPKSDKECACIRYFDQRLYSYDCDEYWSFYCFDHTKNYTFIPQSETWAKALDYCDSNFDHLGFFYGASDLENIKRRDFPVWTGLHRDGQEWKWSGDGVSEYRKWASDEPNSNGDCVAISSLSKQMAVRDCDDRFPFVCHRNNVVLVKKKKTWEEALEHCRNLEVSWRHDYELVSVQPGEEHSYLLSRIMGATTEKVWVGLRFLAGEWLWVNGAHLQYTNLPVCPIDGKHCAALSRNNTGDMVTTNCVEKLNFLCYSQV